MVPNSPLPYLIILLMNIYFRRHHCLPRGEEGSGIKDVRKWQFVILWRSTIPAGRRRASRRFSTSDIAPKLLMPFDGLERPTQAKGEAVLLPSPGPGFHAAGLARPRVVWFGALNAGGHSEFKELSVPFILRPGLTIHKSQTHMAVLASSSAKIRGWRALPGTEDGLPASQGCAWCASWLRAYWTSRSPASSLCIQVWRSVSGYMVKPKLPQWGWLITLVRPQSAINDCRLCSVSHACLWVCVRRCRCITGFSLWMMEQSLEVLWPSTHTRYAV